MRGLMSHTCACSPGAINSLSLPDQGRTHSGCPLCVCWKFAKEINLKFVNLLVENKKVLLR